MEQQLNIVKRNKIKTFRPKKQTSERQPTGTLNKDGTPRKAWGTSEKSLASKKSQRKGPWLVAVALNEDYKNFVEEKAQQYQISVSEFIRWCISSIHNHLVDSKNVDETITELHAVNFKKVEKIVRRKERRLKKQLDNSSKTE